MTSWGARMGSAAIGGALAIGYGLGLGTANQVTYLIEPLRRAHVELFARDWFAMETTHYHGAFANLATELFRADDSGAVAFGVAHLVVTIALCLLVLSITLAIRARHPLVLVAVIASLVALGGGRALGGSYLTAAYFQPSSLATLGWLAALALWLRERPFAAGLALAAGGVFHANFLVLGVAWFGAVQLLSTRRPRPLVALLAPSLVVIAAMAPALLAAGDAADPGLALRVLVEFHAPTHYDVHVAIAQLPPLLGWLLAAWACQPARDPDLRGLWRFALVGSAACTLIVPVLLVVPGATRLFTWRIAPFAQLASQLCILAALLSPRPFVALGVTGRVLGRWRALGLPVGAGVVIGWSGPHAGGLYTVALAVVFAMVLVYRLARRPALATFGGSVVVLAVALAPAAHRIASPDLFDEAITGRYEDVIRWARTTDTDALFVVPPYMHAFRLLARRAIVVDSRSPPLYPDEMVAWYRRMCALVGVTDARSRGDIEVLYDQLTGDQLRASAARFGAQYVLVDKTRSRARLAGAPAFEDWRVVVYAVSEAGTD